MNIKHIAVYFKNHSLIRVLASLKGSTAVCVYTEPLFSIPYNLFLPFASVYMKAIGLSYIQIGTVLSIGLTTQVLSAFLSGVLTDKFGRKQVSCFGDLLCWALPCLIWMAAQNYWWFVVAAFINGWWQITFNSWQCLMVEDADKKTLTNVFTLIYLSGQLSVFFAPLTGIFVSNFSLIPVIRTLYFFSFVIMTIRVYLLYKYSSETTQGKARIAETKGVSILKMILELKDILLHIISTKRMRHTLLVMALVNIAHNTIIQNFFGLYITQKILLDDEYLAFFPVIRSGIMLIFLFSFQGFLARFKFKPPMLAGLSFYILSHILLLVAATEKSIIIVIGYVILEAFAYVLVMPRKDSLAILNTDPKELARIQSVLLAFVIGLSVPFGYLAGLLAKFDEGLPFMLNILIFLILFFITLTSKSLAQD